MRAVRGMRTVGMVAALATVLSGCEFSAYELPLPGGADTGEDPYFVTVEFRDVLDLVPQSSVKVDDVSVGKVSDVNLEGWTAEVTLELNSDVELPENTVAELRQTSLLGEKFIELAPPADGGGTGLLEDGDVIPLDRTGRNPEVEEVLGALSLLLNGGGIARIKTITQELNNALEGREPEVRSVLGELRTFMGQLDQNKQAIITAIRKVNGLALSVREQTGAIESALDTMPGALKSLEDQRSALVRMLSSLDRLSGIGTRVIRQSKADTIANLRNLVPILTQLNRSGEAIPKALSLALTYPFVDAVVGTTAVEARNFHQGDYTNLEAQLDVNLATVLQGLPDPPDGGPLNPVCEDLPEPLPEICNDPDAPVDEVCEQLPPPLPDVCESLPGGGGGGGPTPPGGGGGGPNLPGGGAGPNLPNVPNLPGTGGGGGNGGGGNGGGGNGGGGNGGGGSGGGGNGGGGGGCTLILLCRAAPLRAQPGSDSWSVDGDPTSLTAEDVTYDSGLMALLLQGVVAP